MPRFLHFSDVHLPVTKLAWTARDLLSKKVIGWTNVKLLGRGHRFRHANTVAAAMIAEARTMELDAMLFSGDATKLAFEEEYAHSARVLGVGDPTLPPAVAVPGNHDYYTRRDELSGKFERHFAPWIKGERLGEETYPFARKFGSVWTVALNTSYPAFFNTAARGRAGTEQLQRFVDLCRTLDGPKILMTHYPLRAENGRVERRSHRLSDHKAVLAAAVEAKISLWIHGHIHRPFVLDEGLPFPVICAGSATQTGRWAHNIYEFEGRELTMKRRTWNPTSGGFDEGEGRRIELLV